MKHIITESSELSLINEYEYTRLIRKSDNKILFEDNFYGNPSCGLIDKHSKWVIVAGHHLIFWKTELVKKFHSIDFEWIHDVRQKYTDTVEILIDPWSEFSAIWQLDLKSNSLTRIKSFTKYQDKEYSEDIDW